MEILAFIFYISFSFIFSQSCNLTSFNYEISTCSSYNTQNILITNPNKCLTKNFYKYIKSKINIQCQNCHEGTYLKYFPYLNFTSCEICSNGTYSTGDSFRVKGEYNEWTNELISKFQTNTCKIYDSNNKLITNINCSAFSSFNRKYLTSGEILLNILNNENKFLYVSQFSISFNLIEEGKISFSYFKDTIYDNGYVSGIFKFYINYIQEYSDMSITNKISTNDNIDFNNDFKEYSKELSPGYYTFLFQYNKIITSSLSNKLSLKIKNIQIKGINIVSRCIKCDSGISSNDNTYCVDFEKNEINKIPECNLDKDYYYENNNICDIKKNKQKVMYKLINNSNCKEIKNITEKEINCLTCPIGKYFKTMSDGKNKICIECSEGYYNDIENSNECKLCEGNIQKISYYIINNKKSIIKNITILEKYGYLSIDFSVLNNTKPYYLYLYIDNKLYYSDIINQKTKITLTSGKHSIEIDSENLFIKQLIITNTENGSGYFCQKCNDEDNCINCSPGYEFDNKLKKCKKCEKGAIKEGYGNFDKCRKCPLYTEPNNDNTFCKPKNIIVSKKQKKLFIFKNFENDIKNLCNLNNKLCVNNLYGPIQDNDKNLYFISYNSPEYFSNKDFNYYTNTTNEKIFLENGFIYKLEKTQSNKKILKHLSNKISEIYLVNQKNNKGIIINYIGNNINTYLYFKCSKNRFSKEGIMEINSPRFIYKDKNELNYYFEWKSRSGCPICLTNEAFSMDSTCISGIKLQYYIESNNCIIPNGIKLQNISNNDTDTKDLFLTEGELSKIYNISFEKNNLSDNELGEYITSKVMEIECVEEIENIKEHYNLVVIILPIVSVVILLLCIFILFKYKRTKSDYMKLSEEIIENQAACIRYNI